MRRVGRCAEGIGGWRGVSEFSHESKPVSENVWTFSYLSPSFTRQYDASPCANVLTLPRSCTSEIETKNSSRF